MREMACMGMRDEAYPLTGVRSLPESVPWSFSLTREDILARRATRDKIAAQIEELQQKLAEEDRWFEAVRLIVPPSLISGIEEAIEGAREGPERVSIWRDA